MIISHYFTTNNDRKVSTLTDDAPQWLRDEIYEAHIGLPSDTIYLMFHQVADSLDEYNPQRFADEGEAEKIAGEIADSLVEFRTYELLQWASTPEGANYINIYLASFGGGTINSMSDWVQTLMTANSYAYYCIVRRLIDAIVEQQD